MKKTYIWYTQNLNETYQSEKSLKKQMTSKIV